MNLKIAYGNGVLALPARLFPSHLPPDSTYLYVLFALCRDPALCAESETQIPALAEVCRLPEATVRNAISYWMQNGFLESDTESGAENCSAAESAPQPEPEKPEPAAAVPAESPKKKPLRPAMPSYTQEELAAIQQSHPDLRPAIDSCAQIAGKLFSEHEYAQLTALYDCYGLDSAYLITLFAYCKNTLGKTAVSYVVRTALGLYDDGVRTITELDAMIKYREKLEDQTYQIRRMFGLGERALTAREKQFIENWTMQWSMPLDVIRCAYEITIKNIEKPSMSYVDKILSKWNESGIRTTEEVEAAESAYAKQRQETQTPASGGEHSFDLDEFLSLAMKRSFP